MAATDFASLRDEYDTFLRQEVGNGWEQHRRNCNGSMAVANFSSFSNSILQRFHYVDRINTAIDDYAHRSKSLSVEGWGCPRVDISMAELRSQDNGTLSQRLRGDPLPHMRALEAACHEIASENRPGYDKNGMSCHVPTHLYSLRWHFSSPNN